MAILPNLRSTRQSIGNLDGGSSGFGGTDNIRIQAGTGNFTAIPSNSTSTGLASSAPSVAISSGDGISLVDTQTPGVISIKSIKAGDGISITDTGGSLVISSPSKKNFLDLLDAPKTFTGQNSKLVMVDEANGRLVFINQDEIISRYSNIIISDIRPLDVKNGDGWWESTTGRFFIYYVENNYGQWVESGG